MGVPNDADVDIFAFGDMIGQAVSGRGRALHVRPNVRGNLPAEAGLVRPFRDDGTAGPERAYKACRSGSG